MGKAIRTCWVTSGLFPLFVFTTNSDRMNIYFSVFFGNRGKAPQQGRASSNILREHLAETRDTAHRAKSLSVTCDAPRSMPKPHQKIKLPIHMYSYTQHCTHHVESPKSTTKLLPIGKYRMLSCCLTSPGRGIRMYFLIYSTVFLLS